MSAASHDLILPARRTTGAVFASPHSGRDYAVTLGRSTDLPDHAIRSSEDAFVDLLWAEVPRHGAPLLAARAPRAFIDLNRAPDELDPALVEGAPRRAPNPRIASGLGVIPRVVAGGRPIRPGKMSMDEAEGRIRAWWRPYHACLRQLMDEARAGFGEALLVDCHSMPREAIETPSRGRRPDIVLGDRFGAATVPALIEGVEAAFRDAGFTVARNAPFAGAYIVQTYGGPARGRHAVQVEIDRSIYMDEAAVEPHGGFDEVRERLSGVAARICDLMRPRVASVAAE